MKTAIFIAVAVLVVLLSAIPAMGLSRLHTSGSNIVDEGGNQVHLKGFNLGGWFVMESYMSPMDNGPNPCQDSYCVMDRLNSRFGEGTQESLMNTYYDTWIQDSDIDKIANSGYNLVRIPVWWGNFFKLNNPTISGWRGDFSHLDRIISKCDQRGVYVVIDLHGAIGSQSGSATTGQSNRNQYWGNGNFRSMTKWLWWQIANHYKGWNTIMGYDLLNEPNVDNGNWNGNNVPTVWDANNELYSAVRSADGNRIVIVEGTFWEWNWYSLPQPNRYGWNNVVYSFHEYQWSYQNDVGGLKRGIDNQVNDFNNHKYMNVPCYMGEWNEFNGGSDAFGYAISRFDSSNIHWTMWSFKAVNGVGSNHWGWYNPTHWPDRPNLSNDNAGDVSNKWRNWCTDCVFARNDAIGMHP